MTNRTSSSLARRAAICLGALLLAGGVVSPAAAQAVNPKYDNYNAIPGAEKVDLPLLRAVEGATQKGTTLSSSLYRVARRDAKGNVLVDLVVDQVTPSLLADIQSAGAQILSSSVRFNRVSVGIKDADSIYALAGLDAVKMVRPSAQWRSKTGSADGHAETALRSDLLSSKYDVDGTGWMIGVISDSFCTPSSSNWITDTSGSPTPIETRIDNGVLLDAANQLSGDLPNNPLPAYGEPWAPYVLILKDYAGQGDEGSGMGELIHDIAPGAAIAFYSGAYSDTDFAEGIYQLLDAGANVVVDDIAWSNEPFFMPGPIAQAATYAAKSRGVPYFSAAGNGGNYGLLFPYVDSRSTDDQALPPSGNDLHRWEASGTQFLPIQLEAGATFTAFMQWNQPWQSISGGNAAEIDLDLYITRQPNVSSIRDSLFDASGNLMFSNNGQGTTGYPVGDPIEMVSYWNDLAEPVTIYLAIDHMHGSQGSIPQISNTPLMIYIDFWMNGSDNTVKITGLDPDDPSTGGPTCYGHPIAEGAVAVGAVNWYDTPSYDTVYGPTAEIDPEYFSSIGGTLTTYFNQYGGTDVRTSLEPDIAAVDGNNTSFFGGADFDLDGLPNFFGTSAAAPNAAAVATLLLDMNHTLTPDQITAAMKETAIDIKGRRAAEGPDSISGAGLLDGLAAADYVAENFGLSSGTPAPASRLFAFDTDSDGWTFGTAGAFTSPGAPVASGKIGLTATDSINTIGWWKSPEFLATLYTVGASDSQVSISGITGTHSLFRATARVESTVESAIDNPSFRVRTNTANFEQAGVLRVSSVANGSLSPSAGSLKSYHHYFTLPPNQSRFNIYFDIVGVDAMDAAGTTLWLDEVILEGFPAGSQSMMGGRFEQLVYFNQGSSNWYHDDHAAAPLGGVDGTSITDTKAAASSGLQLGPALDGSMTCFGFWNSPESKPLATLETNRIYCATFRVTSDAPSASKTAIPTFRLRMNDSSFQMSSYVEVNSVSAGANFPSAGEDVDYRLYFEAPDELVGNTANLAFDYLYVPGIGKDPSLTVTLKSMRVDSYERPVGQ